MKERTLELIRGASKTKPITRSFLALLTHKSDRDIRRDIRDLRNDGHWIVAGHKGYYIAETEEDKKKLENDYISRIRSNHTTLKNLRKNVDGQLHL